MAGFWKQQITCDQVAALTLFIENGFEQPLKMDAVFLDLTLAFSTRWVRIYHTGSQNFGKLFLAYS